MLIRDEAAREHLSDYLRKDMPTNGSGKRLNILGALDLAQMKVHTQDTTR